jgi:hypothetical protein
LFPDFSEWLRKWMIVVVQKNPARTPAATIQDVASWAKRWRPSGPLPLLPPFQLDACRTSPWPLCLWDVESTAKAILQQCCAAWWSQALCSRKYTSRRPESVTA